MAGGLRITGGTARGRVLRERVVDGVRPTSSRVREALFSMVGQDLGGLRVLDAFGGSGILGLEAWSRGADVVIVEQNPAALAAIREAGASLGASWAVLRGDVFHVGPAQGRFDVVLADPPYAMAPLRVLEGLAPCVAGWLVYEAQAQTRVPEVVANLRLDRRREFGGSALHLFVAEGS